MKPETRFWKWLSGVLPPEGHFSRVEPPPSPGIPDVNFCLRGAEGWMELKVRRAVQYPFKTRALLRASQRRWFKQRIDAHGRVLACVLIGSYVHFLRAENALRVGRSTSIDEFRLLCYRIVRKNDPRLKELIDAALTSVLAYG